MINWNIVSVDTTTVNNQSNAIVMVRWVCKASSGDKTVAQLGATALGTPDANFIEFADLSNEDVMGFCVANGLDKSAVEAQAEAELQSALSAPVCSPFPPPVPIDWEHPSV
jgi:hypothetical protein